MAKKNKIKIYTPVKLYVTDRGDQSVGINPVMWQVECPFTKKEIKRGAVDKESLEFFRNEISKVFQEFAECKIIAEYDFEF